MSSQWHYTEKGQQRGPISADELKSRAATGALAPEDLVWKEGMAEWLPARSVKGLFAVPPSTTASPPPLPPLQAQLQQAADQHTHANSPPIEKPPIQPDSILTGLPQSPFPQAALPGTTAALAEPPMSKAVEDGDVPTTKDDPSSDSPIVAGIFGGTAISFVLSGCQRLVYGYWMSIWSIFASTLIISGAFAAIARSKPNGQSPVDDKNLQFGLGLGLVFGALYGLWLGGIVSNTFYGACIGVTLAGVANHLQFPFTWGKAVGVVAASFVVLHFIGVLTPSRVVIAEKQAATAPQQIVQQTAEPARDSSKSPYVTIETGKRVSSKEMEKLFEILVFKIKPGMPAGDGKRAPPPLEISTTGGIFGV